MNDLLSQTYMNFIETLFISQKNPEGDIEIVMLRIVVGPGLFIRFQSIPNRNSDYWACESQPTGQKE